jgi:hypothetical protein
MLRHYLLWRYVDLKDVEDILAHSPFIYLRGVLVYSVLLFLVYVAYAISQQYPEYQNVPYVKRIAGVLWLFIFFKRLLWFLNLYLDCILISKEALTIFLRDWLLEYKTEIIDRSKILVISHRQNSFRDKICGKWDLLIQMWNDIDFSFNDVSHPKKSAAKLTLSKKNYEEAKKKKIEQDLEWDQRQFDILVDALWEVIRDYMENKNNEEIYDE